MTQTVDQSALDAVLRPFAHLIRAGRADRTEVLIFADALEECGEREDVTAYLRSHVQEFYSGTPDWNLGWTFTKGSSVRPISDQEGHPLSSVLRDGIVTRMEQLLKENIDP